MNYKNVFKALLETNQLAVSSLAPEQIFQLIVASSAKLLNGNLAALRLLEKDGRSHNTIAVFGWGKDMVGKYELTSGEGLAGWVMLNKKASFCEDLIHESRFPVPELVLRKGAKSVVGVPMITQHKVIGCLIVHFFQKRKFEDEEIDFLQTFANQAAQVIQHLQLRQEKQDIADLFSRYTSPEVVSYIMKQKHRLVLGGEHREAVVLFADIRGFTKMTAGKNPKEVITMLNAYFEPITEIILANKGSVDKFIGDAVMAVWGAPVHYKNGAGLAAATACEMQKAVKKLVEDKILPENFKVGIGVHKGDVVAGNIGSQKRTEYTVIGETVNFASRLADLAAGGEILVSENLALSLPKTYTTKPVPITTTKKGELFPFPVHKLIA